MEEYTGLLTKEDLMLRKQTILKNKKRNEMFRILVLPDKEALRKKISEIYKQEKNLKKNKKILILDETPNRFFKK